ncbi:MAG: queuosine precursor transporter [Tunicatimonas sp.]
MPSPLTDRKNTLFIVLSGIFLTNAVVAELIGVKIFSLEGTLGLSPAQIPLLGDFVLDFNLAAGVVIWPVVFITTDIINEYYGKRGVRLISFFTVVCISYVFVVIYVTTELSPADFWLQVNGQDADGQPFDISYAFNKVYLQGLGIIIGSLVAFVVGQLLDVAVFHQLRRITGKRKIWLRATGSTLVSQLIDSYVVLFIAFYVFGNWPLEQVVAVGIVNYTYKFVVALLVTPLLYVAHYLIDRYLGQETAEQMMEEASQNVA